MKYVPSFALRNGEIPKSGNTARNSNATYFMGVYSNGINTWLNEFNVLYIYESFQNKTMQKLRFCYILRYPKPRNFISSLSKTHTHTHTQPNKEGRYLLCAFEDIRNLESCL